ncbi:hypothetical protein ACA910_007305 [Epithemia clementina (nom. ined.)]
MTESSVTTASMLGEPPRVDKMNRGIQQKDNEEPEDLFLIPGGNLGLDPSTNNSCPGSLFTAPLWSTVSKNSCRNPCIFESKQSARFQQEKQQDPGP